MNQFNQIEKFPYLAVDPSNNDFVLITKLLFPYSLLYRGYRYHKKTWMPDNIYNPIKLTKIKP